MELTLSRQRPLVRQPLSQVGAPSLRQRGSLEEVQATLRGVNPEAELPRASLFWEARPPSGPPRPPTPEGAWTPVSYGIVDRPLPLSRPSSPVTANAAITPTQDVLLSHLIPLPHPLARSPMVHDPAVVETETWLIPWT